MGNYGGNTVTELNASDGSVVQTIVVGNQPKGVSSDGTHVWATDAGGGGNTVIEIDANAPPIFQIITPGLPPATRGLGYASWLQAYNFDSSAPSFTTTLKWKKVLPLPMGLKLSSSGFLGGTPSIKLPAGETSITVQVTEKVITFNGKKKVVTKKTVQATIPLTIN